MEDPQPERGCHRKPRVSLQACLAARQAGDRLRTPWGFQREASSHRSLVQRLVRQKSLKGHRGCVNTVCFTPDGETLVSGSDDRQVILWDWESGHHRLKFQSGHTANVFQARMMPYTRNSTIVTCAADGQVRVAFLREGTSGQGAETSKAGMHQGRAHKLALEPGSAHCFYSCGEDGVVRHFDLREPQYGNRKLLTLEAGYRHWQRRVEIYAVAINPSTPWQMALATGDEYVRVYDTRRAMASTTCKRSTPKGDQPELLHRLCPRHLEKIRGVHTTAVAYSHEGQLLATYGEEDIYLFDYQSRRPRTLKGSSARTAGQDMRRWGNESRGTTDGDDDTPELEPFNDSDEEDGESEEEQEAGNAVARPGNPTEGNAAGSPSAVDRERAEGLTSHPVVHSPSTSEAAAPGDVSDPHDAPATDSDDGDGQETDGSMPSLEELDDSDSNGSMSSPMDSESGGGGTGRPRVGACMDDQDEGGEGDEGDDYVVMSYSGHTNRQTVKGVSFMGASDEYVISGSDCGNVFIWERETGELLWVARGDSSVVNCLEPHPLIPLTLATSGIDTDIKIWAPTGSSARQPNLAAARSAAFDTRDSMMLSDGMLVRLLAGDVESLPPGLLEAVQQIQTATAARRSRRDSDDPNDMDGDFSDGSEYDFDDVDGSYGPGGAVPQCATQ